MLTGAAKAYIISAFVRISSAGRPIRLPCTFNTVIIVRGGASRGAAPVIVYAISRTGLSRMYASVIIAIIFSACVAIIRASRVDSLIGMLAGFAKAYIPSAFKGIGGAGCPITLSCTFC